MKPFPTLQEVDKIATAGEPIHAIYRLRSVITSYRKQ